MSWDWSSRPYRPVKSVMRGQDGVLADEQPDVFLDRKGRVWYAATRELMLLLPSDPVAMESIPPEFWRPDPAPVTSAGQHYAAKRAQEDARAMAAV